MAAEEHPYTFDTRPEVVAVLPPSGHLLDVGSSTGGFAAGIRQAGLAVDEIWGIEPNEAAAALSREHLDHVVTGLFPDDIPAGKTFDTIVFNDVLEHMEDPWGALRATRDLLRPGGTVVASIPNIRYWPVIVDLVRRGQWTYTETGTLDRTHLRFFTRSSAIKMLADTGYRVTRVEPGYQLQVRNPILKRVIPADMKTLQYILVACPA